MQMKKMNFDKSKKKENIYINLKYFVMHFAKIPQKAASTQNPKSGIFPNVLQLK